MHAWFKNGPLKLQTISTRNNGLLFYGRWARELPGVSGKARHGQDVVTDMNLGLKHQLRSGSPGLLPIIAVVYLHDRLLHVYSALHFVTLV